jgi:hypothetical protein
MDSTTNPHALTPDDMRELEREAHESGVPLHEIAVYGRGPLEAGRVILRLLDAVGFGCTILALLAFHFRREGGVSAAVAAITKWTLSPRAASTGALLPLLDAVRDPHNDATDRRLLELTVRATIRDAAREIYDGPDPVQRLEVVGDLVEMLDIAILTSRGWWEARQVPPTSEPPSPSGRVDAWVRWYPSYAKSLTGDVTQAADDLRAIVGGAKREKALADGLTSEEYQEAQKLAAAILDEMAGTIGGDAA